MKISLAINSKNPIPQYLDELFKSIAGFDEVVFYLDGENDIAIDQKIASPCEKKIIPWDGVNRDIKDGFNNVIGKSSGEWICSFCDDDYFLKDNLLELITAMKGSGFADDADVIHFPVITGQGSWGQTSPFLLEDIKGSNLICHGSFFRKECWERIGGYKTNEGTDWNFWIRMKAAGFKFKGWTKPIYHYRMGHARSAWNEQNGRLGLNEIRRIVNETV